MIWLLYLTPAAIAAGVVVSRYGLLAGGATAVAVLIAQTAVLSRLAKRDASVEPLVDHDAAQFKRLAVPGNARHLTPARDRTIRGRRRRNRRLDRVDDGR
ncbi:hypothetical protein [Burkholderia ubonensis]|uniref:hypothetical protein n=1 Tax=Burkholderia ubonensis TaxID=101571 RepID=UPI001E41DF38|nr:hypothetical protein [Burkholderia ubonensis]